MVAVGTRVTAQCTLSVVHDFGWDEFFLPDLRGNWYARRLKTEQRQIDYVPGGPGRATVGPSG